MASPESMEVTLVHFTSGVIFCDKKLKSHHANFKTESHSYRLESQSEFLAANFDIFKFLVRFLSKK